MSYQQMDALEIAKHAAIKRESSRIIKKVALDKLYKDMKKLINEDTYKIKDMITDQMVKNKNNSKKHHRHHKIIFYSGSTYQTDDYEEVFEHCYGDIIDDPLIDQLRAKFPYYKVYSKTKIQFNENMDEVKVYYIYIKWKKNQAL